MLLKFKNPPINEKETAGIHTRIQQRIELLKKIGEEEEIAYNANSEQDLWRFLKRLSFIKSPKLFLLDNGNLRAVWKGDGGKHIGLQFLGGEQIQFVIFSRREGHSNMARIRGRDDFSGIARHLDASVIPSYRQKEWPVRGASSGRSYRSRSQ